MQVPDPEHLLQIFVVGAEPPPEDEEGTEGLAVEPLEEELPDVEVLGAAVEMADPAKSVGPCRALECRSLHR